MRKRTYGILKALNHDDIVSVYTCKLDGMSSRVRNEISELRRKYGIEIITVEGFVGRCAAYFLVDSDANFEKVKMLLKKHKKKKNQKTLK